MRKHQSQHSKTQQHQSQATQPQQFQPPPPLLMITHASQSEEEGGSLSGEDHDDEDGGSSDGSGSGQQPRGQPRGDSGQDLEDGVEGDSAGHRRNMKGSRIVVGDGQGHHATNNNMQQSASHVNGHCQDASATESGDLMAIPPIPKRKESRSASIVSFEPNTESFVLPPTTRSRRKVSNVTLELSRFGR